MFDNLQQQLQSDSPEIRIDALLEAFEYGIEGLKLIAAALEDRDREVRQSALLLLSESETEFAREALYNYLPFSNMDCLHTITEFRSYTVHDPHFFLIGNHSNTLIGYWNYDHPYFIKTWDLATGKVKNDTDISSSEPNLFGIGKEGKLILVNDREHIWTIDTDSLKNTDSEYDQPDIRQYQYIYPLRHEFAISPTNNTLVAIGSSHHCYKKIEIKNYQTYESYIKYKIENLLLCTRYNYDSDSSLNEKWLEQLSTMTFSPDGKFLVINLYHKNKNSNLLHIWDIENKKIKYSSRTYCANYEHSNE